MSGRQLLPDKQINYLVKHEIGMRRATKELKNETKHPTNARPSESAKEIASNSYARISTYSFGGAYRVV